MKKINKTKHKNNLYTPETRQKCIKTLLLSLVIPILISFFFAPFWVALVALVDILVLVWAIRKPTTEVNNEKNNSID